MSGSGGAYACVTGSSGAGRARRSNTCWLWAEDCGSKSACADLDSPKGRSSATTRPARLSLKSAIQHGVSSNSYWQMSRTPVMQQAVSNAERCGSNSACALLDSAKRPRLWRGCGLQGWLKEQGLLSVKDLWCKAQGYTAKRKGKAS